MTDTSESTAAAGDTTAEDLHPEALEVGQQAYSQVVQAADAEAAREGYANRHEFFQARQDRAQAYADAEQQLKAGVTVLSEQRRLLEEIPDLGDADTKQRFIQTLKDSEGLTDQQIAKLSRQDIKQRWGRHQGQGSQAGHRRTIPKAKTRSGQRSTQRDPQRGDDLHGLHAAASLLYPDDQTTRPRPSTPSSTAVEILYGDG